jgi:hypothetical protein
MNEVPSTFATRRFKGATRDVFMTFAAARSRIALSLSDIPPCPSRLKLRTHPSWVTSTGLRSTTTTPGQSENGEEGLA